MGGSLTPESVQRMAPLKVPDAPAFTAGCPGDDVWAGLRALFCNDICTIASGGTLQTSQEVGGGQAAVENGE